MSSVKRDDNFVPVGAASNDADSSVSGLSIDTATGRLLIDVIRDSSAPNLTLTPSRDDNSVPTAGTDDGTNVRPLPISSSGDLQIDLNIE